MKVFAKNDGTYDVLLRIRGKFHHFIMGRNPHTFKDPCRHVSEIADCVAFSAGRKSLSVSSIPSGLYHTVVLTLENQEMWKPEE